MRHSLTIDQTLTANHDIAAAWAGLGSSMDLIWSQKAVPASIVGVLATFLYLGNILVLHITVPALFSLQSFNFFRLVQELIPQAKGSLYFLPSALKSTKNLGLSGGTMYDVLGANHGTGNVTVETTGFNVTCRYLTDFSFKYNFTDQFWLMMSGQPIPRWIAQGPEGPVVAIWDSEQIKGTLFYSNAHIVDSTGKAGFQANLTSSDSEYRIDLGLLSVTPNITKSASNWSSSATFPSIYEETVVWPSLAMPGPSLMDPVPMFYGLLPGSSYAPVTGGSTDLNITDLSVGDISIEISIVIASSANLHLWPLYKTQTGLSVPLHGLENALSVIFAAMMWTSNASVTEQFLQTRLDLSEIAVMTGLLVSMSLALLSVIHEFPSTNQRRSAYSNRWNRILHAMRLYRNRPELETLLEQVEHPTDKNPRQAGLVQTSLVGGGLHSRKRRKSMEISLRFWPLDGDRQNCKEGHKFPNSLQFH
ncbi:hypothetical protein B0H13DRAFT_1889637 [Mycena leptocephala]|nr:hypothetical protein B0H13DRAFT_1889637 [Mycena leptocephala]